VGFFSRGQSGWNVVDEEMGLGELMKSLSGREVILAELGGGQVDGLVQ
jgi:hypothetical protein